jgi:predicted lipid-binding transport protein (Tim44 family)
MFWKKALLLFSLFTFTVAVAVPVDSADAARKGGFSSGKKSYTQTPKKAEDNVSNSTSGTKTSTGTSAATTQNRGFFSGGSLMKGLMIGGIAGLLFGSLFSGMGFFGDFLGLIVNVLAIIVLIALIRAVFTAFRRNRYNRRPSDSRRW